MTSKSPQSTARPSLCAAPGSGTPEYEYEGCVRLLAALLRHQSADRATLLIEGCRTSTRKDFGQKHRRPNVPAQRPPASDV